MTSKNNIVEDIKHVRLNYEDAAVIFKKDGSVRLAVNLDKNSEDLMTPSLVIASALSYLCVYDPEWIMAAIDRFAKYKSFEEEENYERDNRTKSRRCGDNFQERTECDLFNILQ